MSDKAGTGVTFSGEIPLLLPPFNLRAFDDLRMIVGAPCPNCEHCTWNYGGGCARREHPECPGCGHCAYRHVGSIAS